MAVYANSGDDDRSDTALRAYAASCESHGLTARLQDINEASGLAVSRRRPNELWSHNDSDATLFAFTFEGQLRSRVQLPGVDAVDWEAIVTAPCPDGDCLYIGDIGDNERNRERITVYRTPEPAVGVNAITDVDAFHASYPEGPQDAEALFFAGDMLFVVTKGEERPMRLYRFPALTPNTHHTLQLVALLTPDEPRRSSRVTDASLSPDGHWVALRTSHVVLFYRTPPLIAGKPETPLAFRIDGLREPQGEGVAWVDAQTLYLAGEAAASGGGTLGRISCSLPQ